MSVMVRTEDIFHLKNLFRSLKILCSVLVFCLVQVMKILGLFHVIYWSNGYDIWFRPQTFWVRFQLRAVGFPCCEICGTSPTLHILLRRTGTYCDLSGVATWYRLTKRAQQKKTKKRACPKKKRKKNDVYRARLFPSPLQGFFASFRFALYFYCGIII